MGIAIDITKYKRIVKETDLQVRSGNVTQIIGLTIESNGPAANIGDICNILTLHEERSIPAEVVGFRGNKILLMPYGDLAGVGPGSRIVSTGGSLQVAVGMELKGRILDGLGHFIDSKPPFVAREFYSIDNPPPHPLSRKRISEVLPLGVRAIDALLTCGRGQRVGIFAGSGVGKSTLLGRIVRHAQADINVIALVGERGREVNEFLEKDLQEEGLKKSVLVIATSDQPAIVRVKSALIGTAVAEYFRDQGLNVLLLMDSLTRYAMAQREIGMAIGEPPVSRGYTPSVFAQLPRLLERTGNSSKGSITGLYTVLVDGDDMNEPVADTVRGILDGHIVLSRHLANRNHYPAIDVLASVSRLMPDIVGERHMACANAVKNRMATYRDAQDLVSIGAYKQGSNPEIDEAIRLNPKINQLLTQEVKEVSTFQDTLAMLGGIVAQQKP
jgi:flagellum-specific ATP synthase